MENQRLTQDQAARIIASKVNISEPGIHRVKVTGITEYSRQMGETRQTHIVNFQAKTPYHENEAVGLFQQGEYDKAANQGMSLGILEGQFLPVVGQYVDLVVTQVTTKNGVTGLFARRCTPAPVNIPKAGTAEAFLAKVKGQEEKSIDILAKEEIQAPEVFN